MIKSFSITLTAELDTDNIDPCFLADDHHEVGQEADYKQLLTDEVRAALNYVKVTVSVIGVKEHETLFNS